MLYLEDSTMNLSGIPVNEPELDKFYSENRIRVTNEYYILFIHNE